MSSQKEREIEMAKESGRKEMLWIIAILVLVELIGSNYLW